MTMDGLMDSDAVRRMTADELIDELADEEDDVDDLIEAELQRRTLGHLRLMSAALVMLVVLNVVGLALAILLLTGVLDAGAGRESESRDGRQRSWTTWMPGWPQSWPQSLRR